MEINILGLPEAPASQPVLDHQDEEPHVNEDGDGEEVDLIPSLWSIYGGRVMLVTQIKSEGDKTIDDGWASCFILMSAFVVVKLCRTVFFAIFG